MINAFFEGDILNIWVNGQCSITQDYSFYTNKSVCVVRTKSMNIQNNNGGLNDS